MSISDLLQFVPVYVLVFFRVAAMMVFAPLLGSAKIPRRVKALMACVLAMGLARTVSPGLALPDSMPQLAVGIGGEIVFGLAMGMILSFTFTSVQWAGEMIGQQMGFNLSETFDPQYGTRGALVGDMYFMLTLVIFIKLNGHVAMLRGVRASFDSLPLLSVGMNRPLLGIFVGLFQGSTQLALQLAAPILVTLLITDLALGFVGKTMPQLNVMTAGISIRALVGMIVLIVGASLTSRVIMGAVAQSMHQAYESWKSTAVAIHG